MKCLDEAPRAPLLIGPTPLVRLDAFSAAVCPDGPTIWIKRDDLTPLVMGGNKLRKLEFLLGQALAEGADTVITSGAAQSNHACQTAAAAGRHGLRACLLLRGDPDAGSEGSLQLDRLFGAEVRLMKAPPPDWAESVRAELTEAGARVYVIPYGGTNTIGALGYLSAATELSAQLAGHDLSLTEIVVTSSSGGTQAGLALAAANGELDVPVLGVSVDEPADALATRVAEVAADAAAHFGLNPPDAEVVRTTDDYVGPGYGELDDRTRDAIRLLARTEGVLTDPVYTGKALAGVIDLARSGRWQPGDDVLFWHTGGLPALFAYDVY